MSNCWDTLEVPFPADPAAAVRAYADGDEFAWLDSSADITTHPMHARYSLICARPVALIEQFERAEAALRVGARIVKRDASAWRLWRDIHAKMPLVAPAPTGLAPGWVGYVGFEMARLLERLPTTQHDDLGLPFMRMAFYDRGVVLDHRGQRAWLLASPTTGAIFDSANRDAASAVGRAKLGRAGDGGIAGNQPIELHRERQFGDVAALGGIQIGGDLDQQRWARSGIRYRASAGREATGDQVLERPAPLQRAQTRRVGRRDAPPM